VESLKPILLCIVLSGIGYLVYVALNRAPPSEPALDTAPTWNQPAKGDAAVTKSPTDSRATAPGGSSGLVTPPGGIVEPPRSNSPKSSLPFGGSGSSPLVTPPLASPPPSTTPPPYSPPSLTPPPLASSPPATSSPPAAGPMPTLISPSQALPNKPLVESPTVGVGIPSPAPGPSLPPANAAADAETARKRHDFETAMRRAQSDIQQNKLAEALRELSPWYDDAAVPAERQAELDDLLSQLAGSVIYSREHFWQRPHVVQQGETLDRIAELLQVPWQLLAKINGIEDPRSIVAGEQLKIVRGPFDARLNRGRNQLALFVDGLYAGRFDVQVAGDVAQVDGKFPVTKFAADSPGNTIGQKYISLGGNLFLRLQDGATPQAGTMHIGRRDFDDVFDILSERSHVTIRR
jgi:hypothetical protein